MTISAGAGISATLVQPAIYRDQTTPGTASVGDLWVDMSTSPPIVKKCTVAPDTFVSIEGGGGGGGTGTVTSVSVVSANGVTGSVANATTTPAITLTLGAITPSSVASTGSVTGTNLSGTNTGDNAVNSLYSGLVSNATHSGDASGATVLTLATVNSNVGTFGSTSVVPVITVNGKGLTTGVTTATITPGSIGAQPAGTYVTSIDVSGGTTGLSASGGPITTSGTITLSGILNIANGGTGTATPSLIAGTNVTITGTWPNQTINSSGGGGGSSVSGTTTVDFGTGKTNTSVAVSEPTITGGQLVEAWIFPTATATNTADNHIFDDLQVIAGAVSAGVGFTIYAQCRTGFAYGEFTVAWVFN